MLWKSNVYIHGNKIKNEKVVTRLFTCKVYVWESNVFIFISMGASEPSTLEISLAPLLPIMLQTAPVPEKY